MARIRTVKPEFFRHEELYELEKNSGLPCRVAFMGLFGVCDREGRFKWRPRVLKLDVLPFDDLDFEDVLNTLESGGFIRSWVVNGNKYGDIPTLTTHQSINQREQESLIPAYEDQGQTHARICKIYEGKNDQKTGIKSEKQPQNDEKDPSPTEDISEPNVSGENDENICVHMHAHGEGKGRERKGNIYNLPKPFLEEGLKAIDSVCKKIGPLPDEAKVVHDALENGLVEAGANVDREVYVDDRGDGRSGKIDLVVDWGGPKIAIEIDRTRPRVKSIEKLKNSGCEGKVVVLRGCKRQPPDGIDAVFTVAVKSEDYEVPEGINLEAWATWERDRKARHKPITVDAAKKQFKVLLRYSFEDQDRIISEAVNKGHQGIFDPWWAKPKDEPDDEDFWRGVK